MTTNHLLRAALCQAHVRCRKGTLVSMHQQTQEKPKWQPGKFGLAIALGSVTSTKFQKLKEQNMEDELVIRDRSSCFPEHSGAGRSCICALSCAFQSRLLQAPAFLKCCFMAYLKVRKSFNPVREKSELEPTGLLQMRFHGSYKYGERNTSTNTRRINTKMLTVMVSTVACTKGKHESCSQPLHCGKHPLQKQKSQILVLSNSFVTMCHHVIQF